MRPVYYGPFSYPAENEAVGAFVSRIVFGRPDALANYCTMGVFDQGRLIGGTVYNNWDQETGVIELVSGSVSKRWLTRPVIKAMFYLPFDLLGARLAVLRVSEKNATMRGIARRFGFEETVIPRIRADDEAECIYTLSADEWAKHKVNTHGQEVSTAAA